MAHSIVVSAKRGAYAAIGLYVAMVLLVSLSAQSRQSVEPPVQVAYPAIQFEHRLNSVKADLPQDAGVAVL